MSLVFKFHTGLHKIELKPSCPGHKEKHSVLDRMETILFWTEWKPSGCWTERKPSGLWTEGKPSGFWTEGKPSGFWTEGNPAFSGQKGKSCPA